MIWTRKNPATWVEGDLMLDNADEQVMSRPTGDEPGLVRFSEAVTGEEDPVEAAKFADLFLLCAACVGTVFGSVIACVLYLGLFANQQAPTFGWMLLLLGSVALGGASGSAVVMVILHAKDLIRWETRKAK